MMSRVHYDRANGFNTPRCAFYLPEMVNTFRAYFMESDKYQRYVDDIDQAPDDVFFDVVMHGIDPSYDMDGSGIGGDTARKRLLAQLLQALKHLKNFSRTKMDVADNFCFHLSKLKSESGVKLSSTQEEQLCKELIKKFKKKKEREAESKAAGSPEKLLYSWFEMTETMFTTGKLVDNRNRARGNFVRSFNFLHICLLNRLKFMKKILVQSDTLEGFHENNNSSNKSSRDFSEKKSGGHHNDNKSRHGSRDDKKNADSICNGCGGKFHNPETCDFKGVHPDFNYR